MYGVFVSLPFSKIFRGFLPSFSHSSNAPRGKTHICIIFQGTKVRFKGLLVRGPTGRCRLFSKPVFPAGFCLEYRAETLQRHRQTAEEPHHISPGRSADSIPPTINLLCVHSVGQGGNHLRIVNQSFARHLCVFLHNAKQFQYC